MTCIEWADFIRPILVGFVLALMVQITKDQVQRALKLPTSLYTILVCVLVGAIWGSIAGWTMPALLVLFPALAYAGTQVFYLLGRGLFTNL